VEKSLEDRAPKDYKTSCNMSRNRMNVYMIMIVTTLVYCGVLFIFSDIVNKNLSNFTLTIVLGSSNPKKYYPVSKCATIYMVK